MHGRHASAQQCVPGEGGNVSQGTGLLYIAGEKIEGSGTLGQSSYILEHSTTAGIKPAVLYMVLNMRGGLKYHRGLILQAQ